MNDDATDVVRVSLEHVDAVKSVVVENAHKHVVRAGDEPVLAGDETACANGKIAYLQLQSFNCHCRRN